MFSSLKSTLCKLSRKNFGVSKLFLFTASKSFGFPKSFNFNYQKKNKFFFDSDAVKLFTPRLAKAVSDTVLANPSLFGLGLRRSLARRVRLLKSNRSLRGVRHSQSLPVRGQRNKTNARTQKSKR